MRSYCPPGAGVTADDELMRLAADIRKATAEAVELLGRGLRDYAAG